MEIRPKQTKQIEDFIEDHPDLGIEGITDLTRRAIGFYLTEKKKEDRRFRNEDRGDL